MFSKIIVLPKTLEYHGAAEDYQFLQNFEKFEVDKDNETFCTDEYGVLYRTLNPFDKEYPNQGRSLAVYPPQCKLTKYTTAMKGVICIDRFAFCGKPYLKELIVSEGVRTVEDAFRDMANLEYLQLPSSVKNMESGIYGCGKLEKLVITAPEKPKLSKYGITFKSCNPDLVLYVPANLLEEYKADKAYTQYITDIRAIDSQVVGIEQAKADGSAEVKAVYSADGTRLNAMQKGVNIVKMSDGTVKKVMRK